MQELLKLQELETKEVVVMAASSSSCNNNSCNGSALN